MEDNGISSDTHTVEVVDADLGCTTVADCDFDTLYQIFKCTVATVRSRKHAEEEGAGFMILLGSDIDKVRIIDIMFLEDSKLIKGSEAG